MSRKNKEEQIDNFEAIKRLLILSLFSQGVGVRAIADALNISAGSVSNMVPQKNLKNKK